MEKLFAIPFFTTFLTLLIFNFFNNFYDLIPPLILITIGLSIICFLSKHFTVSILFISISIALLTGQKFFDKKEIYMRKKNIRIFSKEYLTLRGEILKFPVIGTTESTITLKVSKIEEKKHIIDDDLVFKIIVHGNLNYLCPGDLIEICTTTKEIRPSINFFPSSSEKYSLINNIHFSGYSKSALLIKRIKRGNILWSITGWIRERIRLLIEKRYLNNKGLLKKEGQMLEALLLGDRGRLGHNEKEALLNSGVFHLFAISGAHIGIIAFFLLFLLNKFGLSLRKKYTILIAILLFFLMLTGFKISAQRAVIMALFISISKILYLKVDTINILCATGLMLLMNNPFYSLDPGFILTFTITIAIVSGRKFFFKDNSKIQSHLKELVTANINASVISLPLSLFFFMRYSFTGFLTGPILIPITALVMCLSIPIIPLSLLPVALASPTLLIVDPILKIFFFLTESFSKNINLTIFRAPPPFHVLLGFTVIFILMIITAKMKIVKILPTGLIIAISIFTSVRPPPYSPSTPEIFFLDVGQGDSCIVVFPGGKSLMIDGGGTGYGNFDVGKQIVLPFLLRKNIMIKWIAVSHYHADHCKGINELVEIIKPDEIWISSCPDDNYLYNSLLKKSEKISKIKKVSSDFRLKIGESEIEFLFPFKILYPLRATNDHSQVIKLTHKDVTVLFTGDTELYGEKALIKKYGEKLKCTLLKVPHHGSSTSSSRKFLELTDPEYAVFSLGYKNRFGFPDKKIKKRYKENNIYSLYTSEQGGIKAKLGTKKIFFKVSRFSSSE